MVLHNVHCRKKGEKGAVSHLLIKYQEIASLQVAYASERDKDVKIHMAVALPCDRQSNPLLHLPHNSYFESLLE